MHDAPPDEDTPAPTKRVASDESKALADLALAHSQVVSDLADASVAIDGLEGLSRRARLDEIARALDTLSSLDAETASTLRQVK